MSRSRSATITQRLQRLVDAGGSIGGQGGGPAGAPSAGPGGPVPGPAGANCAYIGSGQGARRSRQGINSRGEYSSYLLHVPVLHRMCMLMG